jgi:hypothetical protein
MARQKREEECLRELERRMGRGIEKKVCTRKKMLAEFL